MFLVSLLNKNQIDHRYLHHKWNVKNVIFYRNVKDGDLKKQMNANVTLKIKKRHPKIIYLNVDL